MNFLIEYWKYVSMGLAIYFLPTIISLFNKKSKSLGIFTINLLVGWTVIMWISLFFEAFRDPSINRCGEGYDDFEDDNYEEVENESPRKKSKPNNKSTSISAPKLERKENIVIEYMGKTGGWFRVGSAPSSNDYQISQALRTAERNIANHPNFSGKIRARGADSGRIYDMNM